MSVSVRSWPLIAVAATLLGQTSVARADGCTERFVVDRPAVTFNHATVSPACAIFEGGAQIDHQGHSQTFTFPLLFRVGVARRLELRATTDTVRMHQRGAEDTGLSEDDTVVEAPSAGLGFKIMGVEAQGRVPGMGVMATVTSVTNNRFVDEIGAQTLALFDWSFVDPLTLSLSPGLALTPAPDPASTRRSTFLLPAALTWTLPGGADWVSLYGEAYGFVDLRRDALWTQSVGGGVAFRVRHWAQLDAGVAGEVTGNEHPISIFAGASVAF
jgi:hypothetical protein